MKSKFEPKHKFPHSIYCGSDAPEKHSWDTLADWCTLLIGPIDTAWIIEWDDLLGMAYKFKSQNDARFFLFVWQTNPV